MVSNPIEQKKCCANCIFFDLCGCDDVCGEYFHSEEDNSEEDDSDKRLEFRSQWEQYLEENEVSILDAE